MSYCRFWLGSSGTILIIFQIFHTPYFKLHKLSFLLDFKEKIEKVMCLTPGIKKPVINLNQAVLLFARLSFKIFVGLLKKKSEILLRFSFRIGWINWP